MVTQRTGGSLVASIPGNFLRLSPHGNPYLDKQVMYNELVMNGVVPEDAMRQIEEALVRVARRDLIAVADLRTNNLTVALQNIGKTSYEFDRISPVGPAAQHMSILALGDRDLVDFARTAIPVPVTSSQFELDARVMAASGVVETTNVEEHTRAVAEKLEDTLVNGSDIVLGGNTLPGYTNFGCRETHSFSAGAWTSATGLGGAIADVIAMRLSLRENGFSGPYVLYLPPNFDGVLDEDYNPTVTDRTLRERLLAMDGISQVKVLPTLPDDNVLLVQLTSSVVTMPVAQDITTVTWDIYGGLGTRWAILAVITFALKCSGVRAPLRQGVLPALTTSSGIAHLS